jgi:DNA polymerase III gamma/tau subunit
MVKKVFFLVLGFGMIAAGVAGITSTVVDRKNEAAMQEIEQAREKMQLAAAEEQRRQEEERQEIEKLAQSLQQEKQQLEEERRRTEQMKRSAEEAIQERKRAAKAPVAPPPAPARARARTGTGDSGKERAVYSKEQRKPVRERVSRDAPRRSATAKAKAPAPTPAPKHAVEDDPIRDITRKAGMEAARLSEPVEYYNRYTRELVLAEPFDFQRGSVRVRIRVWKNDRLVKDRVISFSEDSTRRFGKTSA